MFKRVVAVGLVVLGLVLLSFIPLPMSTQSEGTTYEPAVVQKLIKQQGEPNQAQILIQSGPDKGQTITASIGSLISGLDVTPPNYAQNDRVLVSRSLDSDGSPNFVIVDRFRLQTALIFILIVIALATIFAGWRGIGSVAGLLVSLAIVSAFIVPNILAGKNPYIITGIGVFAITTLGIYLAHGFNRRTGIALISTYATLIVAVLASIIVVGALRLSGIAGEDMFYLSQKIPGLPLHGLLVCGIIISMVGVLDDITVGQVTTVEELAAADPKLTGRGLYRAGLRVGREHIASLINTLILAYMGTSFLFVIFISATSPYPLLVDLNSEAVMEEAARSLIGGATLILAVPISTGLMAYLIGRKRLSKSATSPTSRRK